jgi:3-oxoacyl-[acyl-carrier-protein] synthase-3
MGGAITGWAGALPELVVPNSDFESRLDTTDRWIVERTGISARHMGGTTGGLAVEAGRKAMAQAGVRPGEVDLLILSTTTPDQMVPATSSSVHEALGLSGGAFDLNAACAGFVYALVVAQAMLAAGHSRILVVGADTLTRVTDQTDRGTAILFGDGAGAILIESTPGADLILGSDLGVDGSAVPLLFCDHGGFMYMEGREVFRRAVRVTVESAQRAMQRAGVGPDDIALFVPHQANLRIVEAVNQRIGIGIDRTSVVIEDTGNTSSASIPLALAAAADLGRLTPGDLVLFSGFGAGMTWASAVARWGR